MPTCKCLVEGDYEDNHVCLLKPPIDYDVEKSKSQNIFNKNKNIVISDEEEDEDENPIRLFLHIFILFLPYLRRILSYPMNSIDLSFFRMIKKRTFDNELKMRVYRITYIQTCKATYG